MAAALLLGASAVHANVPMYSFETGDTGGAKDGFAPNGPGFTLTQDTIGTTQGSNSLKLVTNGGGFIGALTQTNLPAVLSNPQLSAFTFDFTIPQANPAYTGTFADMGVTLFVSNAGEGEFGMQYGPPTSSYANIDLPNGTSTTLTVPLTGNDPDSGLPESFATLLSKGWAVSGFEITDSENGVQTFYLDNIQGVVPEPASLSALGVIGAMTLVRRRRR
jgi:hypothetical protein